MLLKIASGYRIAFLLMLLPKKGDTQMKQITLLMIFILLMSFVCSGCQPADPTLSSSGHSENESSLPTDSSEPYEPNSANFHKIDKQIFDERFRALEEEYSEFIESTEFPGDSRYIHWESVLYPKQPEFYNKLSTVGIKGLPVLIEKSLFEREEIVNNHKTYCAAILRSKVVEGVLRVSKSDYYAPRKSTYVDENDRYLVLYNFARFSKEDLTETLESTMAFEEKMEIYCKFGIVSVPYVLKELEKGNKEFEEFFILIGAHITTPEYWLITEPYYYHEERTGHLRLSGYPAKEIKAAALKEHEKAETFDYKVWLEENEEDLNFLYEYLDAYCEEYEAKNK